MATFKFYSDAGLTTPIVGNFQIGAGSVTTTVYLGSTDTSKKLQMATNPGISHISVAVNDTTPGSGAEASWVKLALTLNGLSSATPGDPLDVGATIFGGVAGAVAVYMNVANALSGSSSSTELSLQVADVKEFAV
jgi:hypothetical protein